MATCSVLLKDGIIAELSEEVDNPILFERLNMCLGVQNLWTFDQSRLPVPDNPTPDNDGEGELFFSA